MSAKPFKAGDRVVIRKGDSHIVSTPLEGRAFVTIAAVIENGAYYRVKEGMEAFPTHSMAAFRFEDELYIPPVKPGTQLDKVLKLTLGQGSWTLSSIAAATGASEAAASARLRDIRALGYTVTCSKPAGEKLRRYTVRSEVIVSA